MPQPPSSLYLASPCYAGMASAAFTRALLALRADCLERRVSLQLDLGGGEALISRARAGMMTRFLASQATHLLFADSETGFEPAEVFRLLASAEPVALNGPARLLLISRSAAEEMTNAHPQLHANLGDVQGGGANQAAMLFESVIEPESGRYLTDLEAFVARWRLGAGPTSAA